LCYHDTQSKVFFIYGCDILVLTIQFVPKLQNNLSCDTEQDDHDEALVQTCAFALASLDRRACARAQMRDANTILEQLVLPISFPWSQCKEILYKPLPRDIDEMSIIMHGDEDFSVIELNNETLRAVKAANIPKKIPIALRRTEDPGVLELRTCTKPTASRLRRLKRACSIKVQNQIQEDSMIHGERSLQMYHEVQLKKRQREEFDAWSTTKRLVSFRVGCTSSRSTIFSSSELSNNPLFLQAIYPKHIQDGVKKSGLEAYQEGLQHGSYNGRPLPSKDAVMNDPTSKNRFIVGRTRLVWSEKERSESKSQRTPYCSILTRQRLEVNSLKRPLTVKVGIRLNGVLVSARQSQEADINAGTTVAPETSYSHTLRSVNGALDVACTIEEKQTTLVEIQSNKISAPRDYSQCTLNLSTFINEVKQHSVKHNERSLNAVDRIRKQISIQRELWLYQAESVLNDMSAKSTVLYRLLGNKEIEDPQVDAQSEHTELFRDGVKFTRQRKLKLKLDITPPRLDCLPTEDGLIHVTCTMPGKIVLLNEGVCNTTSITSNGAKIKQPPLTLSLLLSVLAIEVDRCPGCWKYMANDPICNNCEYGMSLPIMDNSIWISTIGSFWSNLDSMPPAWIHATDEKSKRCENTTWYTDESCCHLCATGATGSAVVTSCAAEGCNVRFHPICAVIASVSNEAEYKHGAYGTSYKSNGSRYSQLVNHQRYENDDMYLCTQYSHGLVETSFTATLDNKQSTIDGRSKKNATGRAKNRGTRTEKPVSNQHTKQNGTSIDTKPKAPPHSSSTAAATDSRNVAVLTNNVLSVSQSETMP
jgi:hypothetical protein